MFNLATLLLPFAVELVKAYIQNSDTKHDDKILDVVKDSCYYLADSQNNDVSLGLAYDVSGRTMSKTFLTGGYDAVH